MSRNLMVVVFTLHLISDVEALHTVMCCKLSTF